MLTIAKKVIYHAFGLSVTSEIPLPELLHADKNIGLIDVEIKKEDLSGLWRQLSANSNSYVVTENHVMFQVPDLAIFSIRDGKSITVSPIKDSNEDQIRLYILGTCMGALLLQRKFLPLHGSAIAINGKAYAIVGNRGAGKSTLAAAFLKKRYQLLSDDVIAVSLSEEGVPYVTPSYPQQKLWENSINELGMNPNDYNSLYNRETKYAVPVHSEYVPEVMPLAGVFELIKTDRDHIEFHPVQGLERLHTLYIHTFRQFLLDRLELRNWHFKTTAHFVNKIIMYRLQRTSSAFTANQLAALILKTIEEENENDKNIRSITGTNCNTG